MVVLRGDAVAGAADDTLRLTRRAERRVVPIMAEPMSTVCWRNIMSRRRRGEEEEEEAGKVEQNLMLLGDGL